MGLPSGNRWAISNLDTNGPYYFQASPYQYECSFFSWGNVAPHNPISNTEFDYDFGGVNPTAPYYEGQPYGDTPGSLLTGDTPLTMDAARRILGHPWYIPETADFQELFDNCIFIDADGNEVDTTKIDKRVYVNGIRGLYLESKRNGARIFFACSGRGNGRTWQISSASGYYWTSNWTSTRDAYLMYFQSGGVAKRSTNARYYGYAIRPIWNPRDLHG